MTRQIYPEHEIMKKHCPVKKDISEKCVGRECALWSPPRNYVYVSEVTTRLKWRARRRLKGTEDAPVESDFNKPSAVTGDFRFASFHEYPANSRREPRGVWKNVEPDMHYGYCSMGHEDLSL
jgi:hypothetical protein